MRQTDCSPPTRDAIYNRAPGDHETPLTPPWLAPWESSSDTFKTWPGSGHTLTPGPPPHPSRLRTRTPLPLPPPRTAYLSAAPQRVASEAGDSACSPGTRAGSWASPLPWATRHTCTASGESWAAARPAALCPPCRDVVMVVGQGSGESSTARQRWGRAGCEPWRAGASSERAPSRCGGRAACAHGRGGWDAVGRGAGEGRGRRRRVGTWRVGTGRSGAGGGEDGAPAWRALRVARALGGAGVTLQPRGDLGLWLLRPHRRLLRWASEHKAESGSPTGPVPLWARRTRQPTCRGQGRTDP